LHDGSVPHPDFAVDRMVTLEKQRCAEHQGLALPLDRLFPGLRVDDEARMPSRTA
jgi:hypothetical protein